MVLGENIKIYDWFHIHFIENKGMAFGWEFGGEYGKLALSLFRIFAVILLAFYLHQLIKRKESSTGVIVSISLIMAGAIGNIIDSTFYGILFSDSFRQVATFLPESGGYAPLMHGRVVDMFYFPLYEGFLPQWMPFFGGKYFHFFRPIFNIADTAISLGVFTIILFYRSFFEEMVIEEERQDVTASPSA